MGWYTTGPGGLEWKYGNVLELSTWIGSLGEFRVVPRVEIHHEEGDVILDYSFLSEWQHGFEKNSLEWVHIPFEGDTIIVDRHKFKPKTYKNQLKDLVIKNIGLFQQLVNILLEEESEKIASATIEIEYSLHISKEKYQDILNKINPSKDLSLLTLADIDAGTFTDSYFELHPSTWMTQQFSEDALLALNGVAFAYKNKEDFYLFQPGDDSWTEVWTSQ